MPQGARNFFMWVGIIVCVFVALSAAYYAGQTNQLEHVTIVPKARRTVVQIQSSGIANAIRDAGRDVTSAIRDSRRSSSRVVEKYDDSAEDRRRRFLERYICEQRMESAGGNPSTCR